jgi:hypothetical protein
MKKFLTLTALATKVTMLLCIGGMGVFSTINNAQAAAKSPCHQQVEAPESKNSAPCKMCETALDSLDNDGVFVAENSDQNNQPVLQKPVITNIFEEKTLEVVINYQTYNPPPDALIKSVTPITKTIILRV